ncbi:glycoside hydrolase family 57 protein [Humisphaera borealis]|uniref:Polysaccharide deacetylase family protein n=1 Tax=Humisphaera borealis TaxID=2807512 RepID=A0A7M2WSM5_9BACT|nr:glycoside hydrolase family 57 protein [Humisphaera borealis]QOV88508.1 polysaccharide deacetylase family protein [Humisphaera borealis]
MASVCFYFQVHQPYRLRRYSVFDTDRHYFDEFKNAELCRKVAHKCYLPANRMLLEAIRQHEGKFRVAFSLSGVVLEQFRQYAPEVLDLFRELSDTGCVEFLSETYYHSLAFLYSREEFRDQVEKHRLLIKELFGQDPRVFRNTELIYNNDLAHFVSHMGYDGILSEGADSVLGYRSPNYVYRPPHAPRTKLLLKNYRLSDDIAFRFSNRTWEQWPLTADKFALWVNQINGNGHVCNLFMDYETFGEHQWAETGIFDFMRHLPEAILKSSSENSFITPSQQVDQFEAVGEIDVPHMISWADTERDLSAWLGNAMQSNALHELYKLEGALKEKGDEQLLTDWRRLTTSDHFYYMCTKFWADGDVHKYFSPYESPYDSYINFMNVLDNVQTRLREE